MLALSRDLVLHVRRCVRRQVRRLRRSSALAVPQQPDHARDNRNGTRHRPYCYADFLSPHCETS